MHPVIRFISCPACLCQVRADIPEDTKERVLPDVQHDDIYSGRDIRGRDAVREMRSKNEAC